MESDERKQAVVLASGGLDSTTVLAIAKSQGFAINAISFDYGQRHKFELEAARKICDAMAVEKHIEFKLDLSQFGGSALTSDLQVPKDRTGEEMDASIPITYVPARNTVFLSVAMGWAETLGATDIFIGVNAIDYSGYPDCRPEFIRAFETMANLATKKGVESPGSWKIHTPLISLTKAEIVSRGLQLGVDYAQTHTCYDPLESGQPCGHCDACLLRIQGFRDAGHEDPLPYPNGVV